MKQQTTTDSIRINLNLSDGKLVKVLLLCAFVTSCSNLRPYSVLRNMGKTSVCACLLVFPLRAPTNVTEAVMEK